MSASIAISVVIRTSNSESPLRRLLKRLKLEPDDEIVIVDTGSIDGTVKVAKEAGATVVENREPFNYSRTLNRGFEAARNEWILVVSSHCEPVDPQFLSSYRTILGMKGETPALICGGTFLSRSQMDRASKTIETTREPWLLKRFAGGNANSLYWKDAWRRHPFDESLLTGEDAEWINWLQKERLLCVLAPQIAVLYRHPGGPGLPIPQGLWRSRGRCIGRYSGDEHQGSSHRPWAGNSPFALGRTIGQVVDRTNGASTRGLYGHSNLKQKAPTFPGS